LSLNAIPISAHPPKGLLQPSPDIPLLAYLLSFALTVFSNHPDPEALRIGRVMLSLPITAHMTSSACLTDSSQFPFQLYGRPLAFMGSSCLPIRLSPLYLHISHRLPPSTRRKVYQVHSPIPSLIPLAITKSQSLWHLHLLPLQSASCGRVLRR
jgi:hypothetical protein